MAQRRDDRAAPPARAPEPSAPYGDRTTPIVDVSREVASAASDMRATSRVRVSLLTRLINLSRDEETAKQAPTESITDTSSLTTVGRASAPPPRSVAVPVTVGLAALTVAVAVGYAKTRPAPPAPPAIASVVAPAIEAAPPAPPAAPTPAAPGATAAEIQAREALLRLRTGLDSCIRNGIHALPGGSPAVPPDLDALKTGSFTPAAADWKTAVWSCAQFQTSEPMTFQLQWQLAKPNAEGMGIAWIDQDRDGVADRALGFSITLGPRGAPIPGEIRELPATTPVRR